MVVCDSLYIYPLLFIFFSMMVYPRILTVVPCAMQQDLVVFISFLMVVCKIQDSENVQRVQLVDVLRPTSQFDGAKPC